MITQRPNRIIYLDSVLHLISLVILLEKKGHDLQMNILDASTVNNPTRWSDLLYKALGMSLHDVVFYVKDNYRWRTVILRKLSLKDSFDLQ